ncbi:hypothetical protein SNE40_009774 [Patella caerulea]|uniref:Uncharacterized protein n=1 Tax=Patella caerulea TaxID=87958 RepID=A0AAN8JSV0_PATCE
MPEIINQINFALTSHLVSIGDKLENFTRCIESSFVKAIQDFSKVQNQHTAQCFDALHDNLSTSLAPTTALAAEIKSSVSQAMQPLENNIIILKQQASDSAKQEKPDLQTIQSYISQQTKSLENDILTLKQSSDLDRQNNQNLEVIIKSSVSQAIKPMSGALQKDILLLKKNIDSQHDILTYIQSKLAPAEQDSTVLPNSPSSCGVVRNLMSQSNVHKNYKVLLIGTSNIKNIKEDKLCQMTTVAKKIAYTLAETQSVIDDYSCTCNNEMPDAIVLHSLTNDIRNLSVDQCVHLLGVIIDSICHKWPNCNIIVSLGTPRSDSEDVYLNLRILNLNLIKLYGNNPQVVLSHNDNMTNSNNNLPNKKFLVEDGYHLSELGVSRLASNIKHALLDVLKIPNPTPLHKLKSSTPKPNFPLDNDNYKPMWYKNNHIVNHDRYNDMYYQDRDSQYYADNYNRGSRGGDRSRFRRPPRYHYH